MRVHMRVYIKLKPACSMYIFCIARSAVGPVQGWLVSSERFGLSLSTVQNLG
jgi:hypothetical protein